MPFKIVVLGGGSAGWLTASIIAAENVGSDVQVHVVESPNVPTIGVGEGSWPTMRETLNKIGLSEAEFIKSCSASFKQGSTFVGWVTGSCEDVYHHPFTPPFNEHCLSPYSIWQATRPEMNYSVAVSAQPALCDLNKAPKQTSTPEFAGVLNYGYHLDAGKFGELLRHHAVRNLSIIHTLGHVESVQSDSSGFITGLKTQGNGTIAGDLFIDCSGAKSLLIGEHYGEQLIDLSQVSKNNKALAVQVPYLEHADEIRSTTVATAHEAGWTWDIGLSSRRGVGYVYASDFSSDDEAWETLRRYLRQTIPDEYINKLAPKKIDIKPGYRKKFWVKNCVAVGMSAGFIEPLEASALALVELSANMIRDQLPLNKENMSIAAKCFNDIFEYRWQRIVEFLKLHYVISQRDDTDYWREMRRLETAPDSLREKLDLWRLREPNKYDFLQIEELFPAISYQYVLYGMGFKTERHSSRRNIQAVAVAQQKMQQLSSDIKRFIQHLPSNRQLVEHVAKFGMAKV